MSALPLVMMVSTNSDRAGAPLHALTLLENLRDRYRFVCVFGEEGPIAQMARILGLAVHIVPTLRSPIDALKDLKSFRHLLEIARKSKPDLIHCHSTKAGTIGRLVAARTGIPSVFTVHGWGWRGARPIPRVLAIAVEKLMTVISVRSRFIYVADAVRQDGKAILGIGDRRGQTIHNGIPDIGAPSADPGELRIIMPARVSGPKDHETLVRAFADCRAAGSLDLCGSDTETDKFAKLCAAWAPSDSFNRIARLGPRSDVSALLARSSVMALTSHFEALPISIIEAMRAGRPVIASDVGGVRELVVDGVTGFLVAKGDVAAVTRAIEALADPALRHAMGSAGRDRYIKLFNLKTMIDATSDVYVSAIGRAFTSSNAETPSRRAAS